MMSNYASGGKHAKHRYILTVNLPDTFRCPKRQIATKKYNIICFSSMCYLNQKKAMQSTICALPFQDLPPSQRFDSSRFLTFLVWRDTSFKETIPLYLTSLSASLHVRYLSVGFQQQLFKDLPRQVERLLETRRT